MLAALLRTLIAALRCSLAASSSPAGREVSLWFVGCVNTGSIQAFTPTGVRDLDPASCYERCLQEGCQFAALSSETCHCGNQLHALVISACFNSSLREETIDVKEGSEKQSPIYYLRLKNVGNGHEQSESLHRSEEPFLIYMSVLACRERVQAERTFGVKVSGKLAGCWKQTADAPTSFSTLHLSVLHLSPGSLVIYLVQGPLGSPPSAHLGSNRKPVGDVVVCPLMSNLSLDVSDNKLTAGDVVSEDTELLKLTLEAESNHSSKNPRDCIWTEEDCNHELFFEITRGVTSNQSYLVSFNISAESVVTVSLLLNAAVKYRSSSCIMGTEAAVVLLFTHSGTVMIQLRAESQVFSQNKSVRMCVKGKRKSQAKDITTGQPKEEKAVRIHAERQVYPTNKDIIFLVVSDIPDPVEFLWDFGDSKLARTLLRTIKKRYHNPGSYSVVVAASWGQMSITSDVLPIHIQRVVKLSRLVHQASVLRNQTLTITCRVNMGTNLTFMWSFGDGTTRPGLSTTHHVFQRLGGFMVKVTASNLISSASLSSHVFVVDRPCQPPPVKNMGPLKLQFQRHEVIHLGVTFETDVNCNISEGLHYSWTLLGSRGQIISLPHTDTQRQSLILQSHLLQYDTYMAIARVQVIGSVVYSNYTVTFQVKPSPPVAFILGGTNVFIGKNFGNMVTLDGQKSYDPDFPKNPLSYSWTCTPVSAIISSCFDQDIPTSYPVLKFPTSLLNHKFDQFQFTLTVHSGERSALSEAYLTVTSHLTGKISVFCHECQGDHLNWDQSFSVSALCEDCNICSELIQYTWSLYLVNTSSKPIIEVPFCYTVDVSAPAAILENPTTSTLTPEMSSFHPPVIDVSQNHNTADASLPAFLTEKSSKTKFKPQTLYLGDRKTASEERRYESDQSDLSRSESSHTSVFDQDTRMLSDHIILSGISSEFPTESSADWRYAFPLMEGDHVTDQQANSASGSDDYDVPYPSVEEGDSGMSAGRSNDAESFGPVDNTVFDLAVLNDKGSNLVDPKPALVIQEPALLDLHRDSVERGLFESYTYTGISSTLLIFRPFSLKPRSIYMLQVTAKFKNNLIGQTQLFLKTNPVPEGMRCQVQPVEGMELHTPFSIFCTSGREDLEYKYSFSVGGRPPRTLYQGRDFQYYFSLPSGDPKDDYEVRIYTEIRSSSSGSATKPCPVTVRVRPIFLRNTASSSSSQRDPALKLSESLKNLSTLVLLGNPVEIHNYISLLTSILNRLSQDAEANTHAQRHMRNVLICTLCDFKGNDQISMADSIFILNELLQVTNQVTLMSVRHVASFVRSVSAMLPEIRADQEMLYSLINSLSYCLQVVTGCSCTPEAPDNSNNTHVLEAASLTAQNAKHSENASNRHAQKPSTGPHLQHGGTVPPKRLVQLVEEILQTAGGLTLSHILAHEAKQHRVSTGLITLLASSLNRTSTIIKSGVATIHMPAALIQSVLGLHTGRARLREQQRCVFRVLTELNHNHCPRDTCPPQLNRGSTFTLTSFSQLTGPVVDLSLFRCSTRRKIHIHSLPQPINIEMQLPERNESSTNQNIFLRNQVNYHSFSISQEILQQAIQITVLFTPPSNKPFPIMLLFRMFERPSPSMHHLKRIHQWEKNSIRITLPPSYLNAAGIAHIALLDARLARSKIQSEQIRYSLTVDSSLCLSWDGQQGAWTHHDCRTHQTDTSSAVNCSCYQLRPLTVFQQQIQSSLETGDMDPFLSASSDPAVLSILAIVLVLYILGLVWSERADVLSKENQRVHYLSDNNPADPYLYAVCIHTGLCSAARMTGKVYIVLYGEDGFSQTKELEVPGCTLFRRNTKDTFMLSAADSLGPVWGVHIWHDNSGTSPDWYLKQVVVSEVNRGGVEARSWLFVSECWLAGNKGDGRVERMLRICSQEIHFVKMLFLRFSDYLADFHMWLCVYSCPSPSSYTHTQRLSVCLLLLLGYSCANTVILSHTDDQLAFDVGVANISAASVTAGLLSVMVVLPVATLISFLFRLTGNKLMESGVQRVNCKKSALDDFQEIFSVSNREFEYDLSLDNCERWAQEALKKKYQDTGIPSLFSSRENKGTDEDSTIQSGVARRNADFLVFEGSEGPALHELLLISQEQNCDHTSEGRAEKRSHERGQFTTSTPRRNGDQSVRKKLRTPSFWCHSLAWVLCVLLSLSCLVVTAIHWMSFSRSKVLLWIHSLCVSLMGCMFFIQPALIFAVVMAVSFWYKKAADFHCFFSVTESQIESKLWSKYDADEPEQCTMPVLCERTSSSVEKQLLKTRERARHLRLTHPPTPTELRKTRDKRKREALIQETLRNFFFCTIMLLLMVCIISGSSVKEHQNLNKAIKRHFIRKNYSFTSIKTHEDWWKWTQSSLLDLLYQNPTELHIVIGEPIIQKTDRSNIFKNPMLTNLRTCDHTSSEKAATISLGHTKSEAASRLKILHSSIWIDRWTVALKVQFTLYSPVSQLFSSVSLITEQSPGGVLLHSAKIQSVTVLHTPGLWDYVVVVCKLLFLFLSLLQSCNQVSICAQQGLMGSWRRPSLWLDVGLLTLTLACYVCCIYHSTVIMEVVSLLQTQHRGHADVSAAANWEQNIRTLLGVILFLLIMKCVTVLGVNRTLSASAAVFSQNLSTLLWPVVSGLILLLALSCSTNLLYAESSRAFSSVPRSLLTLLCHYCGLRVADSRLHSGQDSSHWAVPFLTTTAVWTAMVIGAISSLVKTAKRSQSRRITFTTGELLCYVRMKVSEFTGRPRQARLEYEKRTIHALEELESSIDELLLRLDVLSNSMRHPLRARCYREEATPVLSASPQSSSMDTQERMRSQTMVKKPKPRNKITHESQEGTTSYASNLFRSSIETKIQNISAGTNETLKIKNWLASSVSTSFERPLAENIDKNESVQQAGTDGSRWFTEAHCEVVEVLVHMEPGTGKP